MTQVNFENLLKETMGLDSVSIGSAAIESAIRSRMASLGFSEIEEYWKRICASEDELQELVEIVVVPETWFFRDEETFSVLARSVLKEWLPSHPAGALRLLSAPCCTGEEPYSMVMALLDAGLSRDRLHVDALDISRRALGRAKIGLYGANSFRGGSLGFRDHYFERTPSGYHISDSVRQIVNFYQGNLLATNFQPGMMHYDVIFCRNILIYFDSVTQERLLQRLKSLLAPAGLLFVGSAEAFLAACSGFKSVNESMSFAFRTDCASPVEVPTVPRSAPSKRAMISPMPQAQRPVTVAAAPTPALMQPSSVDLESAKRLADVGRLADAGGLCEAYLKENGAAVQPLYLLGLVKDAMGDSQRAAECYRKVLYLEPGHVEALMHLALLSEKQGDTAAAERLRDRARRTEMVTTA